MAKVSRHIMRISLISAVLAVLPYIIIGAMARDGSIMADGSDRAIISGDGWLGRYAGGFYDSARSVHLQETCTHELPRAPWHVLRMRDCRTGFTYVHVIPAQHVRNPDVYAALLDIDVPPGVASSQLVSTVRSLITYDTLVEPGLSAKELRERLCIDPVGNPLLRGITHRGMRLRFDDSPNSLKLHAREPVKRMGKFIWSSTGAGDQPAASPGGHPKSTIWLFDYHGYPHDKPLRRNYARIDLDSPTHYAIYETIVRRSQITDVLLSRIHHFFNSETRYRAANPYSIVGSLSFPELKDGSAVLKAVRDICNPQNMTLYIFGKLSVTDALGSRDDLAAELPNPDRWDVGYSAAPDIYGRRGADGNDQENAAPLHIPDVLDMFTLPKYFLANSTSENFIPRPPGGIVDDDPWEEWRNSISSVSVLYTLNTHFAGRSLLYRPIFKYFVESILSHENIGGALVADINIQYEISNPSAPRDVYDPVIRGKTMSVTVEYETDHPFLLFTFYDIRRSFDEPDGGNDHTIALNLMNAVKTVLGGSSDDSGSEFWERIRKLDGRLGDDGRPSTNYLQKLMEESHFFNAAVDDGDARNRLLEDIASIESMGYVVTDGTPIDIAYIVNDITRKNGRSVFKYLSDLFASSNSSNPDAITFPIIVSDYQSVELLGELALEAKESIYNSTRVTLDALWGRGAVASAS